MGDWSDSITNLSVWHATKNLTWLTPAHVLSIINSVANVGFKLMIPIMGAYIAYSISGRAGIAPAMITTFLLTNPGANLWFDWNHTFNLNSTDYKVV